MVSKTAKQVLADDHYNRAIELYDLGYNRINEDEPGILYRRGVTLATENVEVVGGVEPIEVPMEIWFFMRGATFGIGDFFLKSQKAA